MCGIYGSTIPYTKNQVGEKLKRTSFRGPDQMGVEVFNSVGGPITFGHNRLSIIDLDARSNQPFTYGNVHVVFNGEIYNFKDLRSRLSNKGYTFRTSSDTEVLCAAYQAYGEDCVKYLNGMFAFVIYDQEKQILYGAKDRLGQKPFYYYLGEDGFEFASQISSIQLHHKELTVSSKAINGYFAWKAVPSPFSIFNEIKKLEDGCRFTYDLGSKQMSIDHYWDIPYTTAPQFKGSFEVAKNELESLLVDAIKGRMFADVPVGVFLSGGIDSSLVAALAANYSEQKVKTFSVKFNEKRYDESAYAQEVADRLGTDHHVIECDYKEGLGLIDDFSYYYDEPFADPSAIPSMLLAKHTRKKVTVALTGDGADESFLGYNRYTHIEKAQNIFKIPYPLRKMLGGMLKWSPSVSHQHISRILASKNAAYHYLGSIYTPTAHWLENTNPDYDFEEMKYLLHSGKDLFSRAGDMDLKTYMSWDINTKVDRASMAYSLEARSPFLDYRVVEFAQSLPTSFKYRMGYQKRILREILYGHLPSALFERPKSGFGVPLSIWFRENLKDFMLDHMTKANLEKVPGIKVDVVLGMVKEHLDGKRDHSWFIWKMLVLIQWLRVNAKGLSVV